MAYQIVFDPETDPEIYTLATAGLLVGFHRWVDDLRGDAYADLIHFSDEGCVTNCGLVAAQIRLALGLDPPEDVRVRRLATRLMKLMDGRAEESVAVVREE